MAITTQQQSNIIALTVGMFNAAPGAQFLSEFSEMFENNGESYQALADALATTGQFQSQFAGLVTQEGRINKILSNLGIQEGTDAYTTAKAHFDARIEQGATEAELIVESLEYLLGDDAAEEFADVQAQLNNKVEVATFYSVEQQQSATTLDELQGVIADVTADPATVEEAKGEVEGGTGQTFTLTASGTTGSFDNLTGTAGNDTFNSGPGFLETGDNLNGAAGTDVLNARLTDGQTTAPTVSNVENIFVRVDGADNAGAGATSATFSMTDVSGAEQVWADRITSADANATNGLVVSGAGLTTDVTVGVKGGAAAAANRADATFTFAGVAGTADEATLALDGASVNNVSVANIETLNVATQGNASRIDGSLNAAAASSIVFTGAANATIDATDFANTGYAVDASAFTGGLNITLEDQASGNTSFTGGTGDDRVSLGGGLDTNDTIDGGEGRNTINVTAAADLTAATGAKLSNFQVFDAAGATGTFDMDFIDGGASASTIDALNVSAALGGGVQIDNLANGADVTIGATTGAALTVNQKGADVAGSNDDVLNYELTGSANITAASLVAANIETVNITSTATVGSTTGHEITATTFANAETVAFSGDEQLTVGTLGAVAATKIDASAMTDKFIMTNASTSAETVLIEGGSAADTLRLDANVQGDDSTIQGNGGADTIVITNSDGNDNQNVIVKYSAQSDSTGADYDNITGFNTAGQATNGTRADTIDLTEFGITGAAQQVFTTTKATVDAANDAFSITAADAAGFFDNAGTDRGVAFATAGGDGVAFVDVDGDGNWNAESDMAIYLQGVTDLATADVAFA